MTERREFERWEPMRAASLVKEFEGCKLEAYRCPAGVVTIGYGHTGGVSMGEKIDQAHADRLLTLDLEKTARQLNGAVKVPVSANEFRAILSLAFNVGAANVRGSTLLKKLNASDRAGAALQFPKWCYADGKKLKGLEVRREREAQVFLS